MRGQRHSGRGTFFGKLWGKETFSQIRDCVFWFGVWVDCCRVHQLLGVLGSTARNPHGILELGNWIGSVPGWQGGRVRFWVEQ
jgi:hypothetical protein